MNRDKVEEVVLKVTRNAYQSCGECMFLSKPLSDIYKHGATNVYCNLFQEDLEIKDYIVIPTDSCSNLS